MCPGAGGLAEGLVVGRFEGVKCRIGVAGERRAMSMRRKGWDLTDRDREILWAVTAANALSARQLHLLTGESGDLKNLRRRLVELSEPRGLTPRYLRVHRTAARYTFWEPLFTLAAGGADLLGLARYPDETVGLTFAEHAHYRMTGDLFVSLCQRYGGVGRLPVKWFADTGVPFRFEQRRNGESSPASVRPDVIVDSRNRPVRIFLEFETGSHPTDRSRGDGAGSIFGKLRRYQAFFFGTTRDPYKSVSWYRDAFQDDYAAVVMVVVHSRAKQQSVLERLRREQSLRDEWCKNRVRVVPEEEALDQLVRFV